MPTVFVSYSHDNDAHKQWVRGRCEILRSRGIDVILDQFDLKYGDNMRQFIEDGVKKSDYILLVCTPSYKDKAEKVSPGYVSIETEAIKIVAKELRDAGKPENLIAILRSGDEGDAIPFYMKDKRWVDMKDDNDTNWDALCGQLLSGASTNQQGELVFHIPSPYDRERVYEEPNIDSLRRFSQFLETGMDANGRWYVKRLDPIENQTAMIFFQDPVTRFKTSIARILKSLAKR